MTGSIMGGVFGIKNLTRVWQAKKGVFSLLIVAVLTIHTAAIAAPLTSLAAEANVAPTGTYTDWHWPGQHYDSYEWQVTPGVDQTGPDAYYYAHQFGFVDGDGGYAGMQGDFNGKRAIFSLWQALAATGPGIAQPFDGEGFGYQTIINYDWIAGRTYQYQVQKLSVDTDGTWWGATVKDVVTGVVSPIGQIKVPLPWGGLGSFSLAWTERYGGQMSTCNDIHYSKVDFTNFTANNGTILPLRYFNRFSDPINCPGSRFTDIPGGARQEMGVGNELPPVIVAGAGISVSDLIPLYVSNGYGPLRNDASHSGRTIILNGQRYQRGLGVHAAAEIRYDLSGQYSNFYAHVGVDDYVNNAGSVIFQVWADGIKLYDSGLMTGPSPTQSVSVNVKNRRQLTLLVLDGGDGINFDHANWADARLKPRYQRASVSNR